MAVCCQRPVDKADYTAYLFTYFTGNHADEEAIRFAVSRDGLHYTALNNNRPIIRSEQISEMGAVRDPHLLRAHDGSAFYMVVTDMKSDNGWNSNHGMVLLKSTDLLNWTHRQVNIATQFPQYSAVNRVWAPQTIYDVSVGKYMVYWSMRSGDNPDVIHYAYANSDFTGLETTPQVLLHSPTGSACIDGDIVCKDGQYHLFFKTEGSGNGIKKAVADQLTGPYQLHDRYLQATTDAVEGSCVFKLNNTDTYILIYDVYGQDKYQFTQSTDLLNFAVIDSDVSMNFKPRHGTVIPITEKEFTALTNKWPEK